MQENVCKNVQTIRCDFKSLFLVKCRKIRDEKSWDNVSIFHSSVEYSFIHIYLIFVLFGLWVEKNFLSVSSMRDFALQMHSPVLHLRKYIWHQQTYFICWSVLEFVFFLLLFRWLDWKKKWQQTQNFHSKTHIKPIRILTLPYLKWQAHTNKKRIISNQRYWRVSLTDKKN